jgi:hypothetical protein
MRFTDNGNGTCFDRFSGQTFSHFYFIGLECYDSRKDPSSPDYESSNGKASASDTVGFRAIDSGDDILVEDNYFHFLAGGLVIQYNTGPAPQNIRIRRNNITDMYAASGAHSQGAFLANITNLLVEDNLFDHNAWNDEAGIPAWIFNHHMYIVDSYITTIRNNLMLRDESLSLKLCSYAGQNDAFAGALIYNNLIFEGEVGLSMGYGASAVTATIQPAADWAGESIFRMSPNPLSQITYSPSLTRFTAITSMRSMWTAPMQIWWRQATPFRTI